MELILASQSPRRIEILKSLGLEFITAPSDFQEKDTHDSPAELVVHNAQGKARDIAQHHPNSIIIGADTIGVVENQVLGKPRDRDHAYELIELISGTNHQVMTGLCMVDTRSNIEIIEVVTTEVKMSPLSSNEINTYLDTSSWEDKAAAYAIQGRGALFIEEIKGDYFNIVGLPIFTLNQMLKKLNFHIL